MPSALRSIRVAPLVFFELNVLILTLGPQPASSRPISLHSSPLVDNSLTFDVAFGLASFVIVFGTWAWIANGITIVGLVTRISSVPITLAQELFSYLRPINPFRVATARALDSNNTVRRASTRRRGGLSYPVSSTPGARY